MQSTQQVWYACEMNNFEHEEAAAAKALVDHAFSLVKGYVEHPGDIDAAMQALLVLALENVLHLEISVEKLRQ